MPAFDSNPDRDVLVTGLGMVTPLGASVEATWQRLPAGETAARELNRSDIDDFDRLQQISGLRPQGAVVDHQEIDARLTQSGMLRGVPDGISRAWRFEPLIAMALVSVHDALEQAGLSIDNPIMARAGVVFGSSKGGMRSAEQVLTPERHVPAAEESSFRETLRSWTFTADSAMKSLAVLTSTAGPVSGPVAACATGLISVLEGAMLTRSGDCDICITGSSDAALRASVLSSFHRLRVTSRNPDAASACRPFDRDRDGFLLGEGAAAIVLESAVHAAGRGARAIARVSAGGWLTDPTGMTQVDASGDIVAALLHRVLEDRTPPDVFCLHGTGTETNDLAEARGVARYLDGRPPAPCFGVKGAIGHLLGAAGSVESALAIRTLRENRIPGTRNLSRRDDQCPIAVSSSVQSHPEIRSACKLSLGFGGHVACGLFESV